MFWQFSYKRKLENLVSNEEAKAQEVVVAFLRSHSLRWGGTRAPHLIFSLVPTPVIAGQPGLHAQQLGEHGCESWEHTGG